MNSLLQRLLAILLLTIGAPAWSFDPCPVCGGKVTNVERLKDDLGKPSRNIEIWNRSMCANLLLGGALVCTKCWLCSYFYEEDWKRMSELRDSFIPPIDKAIHDFPLGTVEATYDRRFAVTDLTDSMEFGWDGSEDHLSAYKDYCKQHGLFIQLQRSSGYSDKVFDVTDDISLRHHAPRLADEIDVTVRAKPKALYEKALPPKRPLELRTAKAEYLRSAETLRIRYVDELLGMLKKAETKSDDLAANNVKRELKSLMLPKESDAKELTKLLIGKWKPLSDRSAPFYRDNGTKSYRLNVDDEVAVQWHIEGNELVEALRYNDEIVTRRSLIILLTTTRFVYVTENESIGDDVCFEERIVEKKRR